MSTLNAKSTVAQWVSENPQTAKVFEELQIDYCCGGGIALAEACEKKQLDANEVLSHLQQIAGDPSHESRENWLEVRLGELCDHIETTHHAYLRNELPRLAKLIGKVVDAHGASHPGLRQLQQVFSELRAELEPHMMKEERILFPAIRQLEEATAQPSFPFGTVVNPISMMEHEHDAAGNALARIRDVTNGFQPPDDACNTYRIMLDALQRLGRDLQRHIHKENFILFPKARKLESSLSVVDA